MNAGGVERIKPHTILHFCSGKYKLNPHTLIRFRVFFLLTINLSMTIQYVFFLFDQMWSPVFHQCTSRDIKRKTSRPFLLPDILQSWVCDWSVQMYSMARCDVKGLRLYIKLRVHPGAGWTLSLMCLEWLHHEAPAADPPPPVFSFFESSECLIAVMVLWQFF